MDIVIPREAMIALLCPIYGLVVLLAADAGSERWMGGIVLGMGLLVALVIILFGMSDRRRGARSKSERPPAPSGKQEHPP